jgi:hypothetical protein
MLSYVKSMLEACRLPLGPLKHRCDYCARPQDDQVFLRCEKCSVFRYCCKQHEIAHNAVHSIECSLIASRVERLSDDGPYFGRRLLDHHHLHDSLVELGTLDSLNKAKDCILDTMRMVDRASQERSMSIFVAESLACEALVCGWRYPHTFTLLRLGLDKHCYNLVGWWAKHLHGYDEDWVESASADLGAGSLDILKTQDFLCSEAPVISLMTILLLKLKVLIDIRNMKVARKVLATRGLPMEIGVIIELAVIGSPLSASLFRESSTSLLSMQIPS